MSENKFMKDTAYDVFISHVDEDKKTADAMCHYLEEQKIRCWIAPRDILPGQDVAQAIVQGIKKTKIFVLVCSHFSLRSAFVQRETNLAVSDEKIIIPFKIDDCSLDGTGMRLYLNDRHWIEAVPKPEKAFGDLAAAIIAFLGARPPEPGERTPAPAEQSGAKAQYEFDGAVFSKKQILRIARFQTLLSFCIPIHIFMLVVPMVCGLISDKCEISSPFLRVTLSTAVIGSLILFLLMPPILFAASRVVQKKNLFFTFISALFLPLLTILSPVILLYEAGDLRKIVHAAGLKTSFWGVPRSEIRKFAEGPDPRAER